MKVMQLILASFLTILISSCGNSAQGQKEQEEQIAVNVNAEELHGLIAERGGQILDVRTEGELASGMLPGAIHMDFYSNSFAQELEKLDRSKPVFVYCAAGGRSGKAMGMMKSMDFKEVYNLSGGFPTWKSAGYEVHKK
ncbi:MAG: rhodanese-like domain-containing protein [Vicingaceae bacterium]